MSDFPSQIALVLQPSLWRQSKLIPARVSEISYPWWHRGTTVSSLNLVSWWRKGTTVSSLDFSISFPCFSFSHCLDGSHFMDVMNGSRTVFIYPLATMSTTWPDAALTKQNSPSPSPPQHSSPLSFLLHFLLLLLLKVLLRTLLEYIFFSRGVWKILSPSIRELTAQFCSEIASTTQLMTALPYPRLSSQKQEIRSATSQDWASRHGQCWFPICCVWAL